MQGCHVCSLSLSFPGMLSVLCSCHVELRLSSLAVGEEKLWQFSEPAYIWLEVRRERKALISGSNIHPFYVNISTTMAFPVSLVFLQALPETWQ